MYPSIHPTATTQANPHIETLDISKATTTDHSYYLLGNLDTQNDAHFVKFMSAVQGLFDQEDASVNYNDAMLQSYVVIPPDNIPSDSKLPRYSRGVVVTDPLARQLRSTTQKTDN
jgi:hypothetical protein